MTIKKLESATKIMQQIKMLDNDIIQIDKLAMLIANENVNCSFTLNVEDLKPVFDAVPLKMEEQRPSQYEIYMEFFNSKRLVSVPVKNISSYSSEANENTALHLLGVLLMDKQNRRTVLLNQLTKYGVQL